MAYLFIIFQYVKELVVLSEYLKGLFLFSFKTQLHDITTPTDTFHLMHVCARLGRRSFIAIKSSLDKLPCRAFRFLLLDFHFEAQPENWATKKRNSMSMLLGC
jgi:hypothetical protein